MTPDANAQIIKRLARETGFDLVGIARPEPTETADHYRAWLANGYAAGMAYMAEHADIRAQPLLIMPAARSVICVAVNYRQPQKLHATSEGAARRPKGAGSAAGPVGKVAQYARGSDYHVVMRRMLEELAVRMRDELDVAFDHRVCVDTAPILERELARRAGLGWVGKNTMVLSRELGSYVFLGELFTTLDLPPDAPATDHCGTCTRCLDACPTRAIVRPRVLDATRCISYLTIEHRGDVPRDLHDRLGTWVFGCDVCQDVCPFNQRAPRATHPDITAEVVPAELDLHALIQLGSGDYRRLTRGSATVRARRGMWRRNAVIALKNTQPRTAAAERMLDAARRDADAHVRHAAGGTL